MKHNYFYTLIFSLIFLGTLLGLPNRASADAASTLQDSTENKTILSKLSDTRTDRPKSALYTFKPFAPYAPYLKMDHRESAKTLSNVKIYPNPISEQLNLTFKLSKTVNVSIKIMDALGNEINTLLSEELEEGNQVHTFSIKSNLNSGFYFIRIMAGTETVVKRIQIV
ncbi:T9SS type A sorting domain-containing protein [Albibacterium indicum]|uniref:T9SS type A sorting domain-containing protein n=1 Tax=Albibacterium indicum TaxID=2292082 RepID=UPI000E5140ED|nr:T9SS type A sorting domain-containing protein [Pedobacter indicus]